MANIKIQLAYKTAQWFTDHADYILAAGQVVYLEGSTKYKVGDGENVLSVLEWSDKGLNDEATARANADDNLQTNIDNEASARGTADGNLQTNIDNEASARGTADTTLQGNIDTLSDRVDAEAITRAQVDSDEADARVAADNALQTAIDNEVTDRQTAIDDAVTALKDGVSTSGDSLQKLYNLVISNISEGYVADIAARNAYNIPHLPYSLFVTDDGDGRWAKYQATSTGVGATFVKISDPDLLNAAMTAYQIKVAYESNSDTNAFTNALLNKLNAIAAGATANDTDANLKNRENHSGTQDAITITGTKTSSFIIDFATAAINAAPAETTTTEGALINGATSKATPVDADYIGLMDSAAANVLKKLSWANVKARLKSYFDTLYREASTAISLTSDVSGVLPKANGGMDTSMYHTLMQSLGYLNSGNSPGTYYLITTNNAVNTCASGVANAIQPQVIYINSVDYPTINGLAPKLRIRVTLMTNATNTTGTWTFGLFPITAGAGGVGNVSHTIGTVISGSNGASQINPLASQVYNLASSDFDLPPNGLYAICVTNTAIATNATIQFNAQLQIHNA